MSQAGPPPGWYPDPSDQARREREWDGEAWTPRTRQLPGLKDDLPAAIPNAAESRPGSDAPLANRVTGKDGLRPDIQRAWDTVKIKLGNKRDVKKLVEYLHDGEVVEEMVGGRNGGNSGLLVATNRRALFVAEGVINHSFEDFPYDRITSITSSRSLTTAKITILAGGAARVIDQVEKASAQRVSDHIRAGVEAAGRRHHPAPASTAPPADAGAPPPRHRTTTLWTGCKSWAHCGIRGS